MTQQQDQNEGIKSDLVEEGSGGELVEAEVWFAADTPSHIDAYHSTAIQPTRPKRPKNWTR
jgi:hypothetical protein